MTQYNISWQNFTVIMFQSENNYVTDISYEEIAEHKPYYGVGQQPIAKISGPYRYRGSISMYTEAWKAISDAANGNPFGISPFDIAITVYPTENSIILDPFTDTLYNCFFLSDGLKTHQGDTSNIVEIPLLFFSTNRFD